MMIIHPYVFDCKYAGDFRNCTSTRKRRLTGPVRNLISQKLVSQRIAPSYYRKLEAEKCMNFGDTEPKSLPSQNALRIMKCRELKRQRVDDDPVHGIHHMMYSSDFGYAVKAIGLDPFFAIYWSAAQIHVYRSYCET